MTDNHSPTKLAISNSDQALALAEPGFDPRHATSERRPPTDGEGSSIIGAAPEGAGIPGFRPQASTASWHLTSQQLQFLMRITPPALASQQEYEIPACVTVAQAILESATTTGWGSSPLFRLANNPFGIKYCHFPIGERLSGKSDDRVGDSASANHLTQPGAGGAVCSNGTAHQPVTGPAGAAAQTISTSSDHSAPEDYGAFEARTWEIENGQKKWMVAQFQRFPNLEEAFRAHALLLCSPRYRPAFEVRHDWKKFAERLGPKRSPLDSEHCGYSTSPSYPAEIVKLVTLYRLDDPRAQQWYATGKDPGTTDPQAHEADALNR